MKPAQFLIRLDDACPWHDRSRWQHIEDLLDRYHIKPLVAIIPQCLDPDLLVFAHDVDFWSRARSWQAKGWELALHGSTHQFETKNPGLVPLNRYSEFAGVSEEVQRQKICSGMEILHTQGLQPRVWVAPAHSFDRTTLKILTEETSIRLISDGLSQRAFRRFGFVWIPQQLWRPRKLAGGLWTLCLHPNEMKDQDFKDLEEFLKSRPIDLQNEASKATSSWAYWVEATVGARPEQVPPSAPLHIPCWGLQDPLFECAFLAARWGKKVISKTKKFLQQVKAHS